jgi:GTP-binding protein
MKVVSATFVGSYMRPEQYPRDGRPEFAFVGRSNVGKSTLLNKLLNRKGLAKTSGTPGKTQTVNFFDINGKVYFVDLPGYGYAKVPVSVKNKWGEVMSAYLSARPQLRLVIQLVDARHKPSEKDIEMLALLDEAQVPTLIAATKVDKVKPSEYRRNMQLIKDTLELADDALIVPASGLTGNGVKELWEVIDDLAGA